MGLTKIKITENFPLASLTTFNVGGPARFYVSVRSEAGLLEALDFAKSRGIPLFVLGGGSNILVSDGGFDGLVIHNGIRGITIRQEGEYSRVHAGSGEDWQKFVDRCVSGELQGVECLAGIPGTVGASPVQNIGAYGQEVSDTIVDVGAVEVATGNHLLLDNQSCGFGYRTSIFNSIAEGNYIITRVSFRLRNGGKPAVTHREIANHLKEFPDSTIRQVRDGILAVRAGKGLLVRKGYDRFRCAGSFFKNPLLLAEHSREVEEAMKKLGDCAHLFWPVGLDEVKISAAGLIERAGFRKGYRKGNVGLSPGHTLILIAYRRATAREIMEFAEEVQGKVKEKFGVVLKPEVRLVGFPPSCLAGE